MIKILHVITGLSVGGAEMMLYRLLLNTDRNKIEPYVISLTEGGDIKPRIEALGIKVFSLNMSMGPSAVKYLFQVRKLCKEIKPDIIQGWMYHGNFFAQVACMGLKKKMPVVWNITHSLNDLKNEKRALRILIGISSKLSKFPAKIIYCSQVSAIQHESIGYNKTKTVLIPNGFDTALFKPDKKACDEKRKDLELKKTDFLIGIIARYHPAKDHNTFLEAAAMLIKYSPSVKFLLAGRDVDMLNESLVCKVKELGIGENVILLGERIDIPEIMAALDLYSSSSVTEAFPITIGEAMSCGLPCVVTDVGDCAYIVGQTGIVVPPRNPEEMAKAWQKIINLDHSTREKLGEEARKIIEEKFSLPNVVKHYEHLYESLTV
ncbi:MAG TPA: glycosyltransferase [Clostridia bacterium]|nr:glycosyltransferase [Clostridia bacterium]